MYRWPVHFEGQYFSLRTVAKNKRNICSSNLQLCLLHCPAQTVFFCSIHFLKPCHADDSTGAGTQIGHMMIKPVFRPALNVQLNKLIQRYDLLHLQLVKCFVTPLLPHWSVYYAAGSFLIPWEAIFMSTFTMVTEYNVKIFNPDKMLL